MTRFSKLRIFAGKSLTWAALPAVLALTGCGTPAEEPDATETTMAPNPVGAMETGMAPDPTMTPAPTMPMPMPMPIPMPAPDASETGTATMRGPGTGAPPDPTRTDGAMP